MKKFLSLALALILVLSMVPALAENERNADVSIVMYLPVEETFDWELPTEIELTPNEDYDAHFGEIEILFSNVFMREDHYIHVYGPDPDEEHGMGHIDLIDSTAEIELDMELDAEYCISEVLHEREEGKATCYVGVVCSEADSFEPYSVLPYVLPVTVIEFTGTMTLMAKIVEESL